MVVQLTIRYKKDRRRITNIPADVWALKPDRKDWEIVEPEQQKTVQPEKTIRADSSVDSEAAKKEAANAKRRERYAAKKKAKNED